MYNDSSVPVLQHRHNNFPKHHSVLMINDNTQMLPLYQFPINKNDENKDESCAELETR